MVTYDDAKLVMRILQWAAQTGADEAFTEIYSDTFNPETVSYKDPAVRKVLNLGETIGTFVKQGVLSRDLVYDLWAIDLSWKRVGPAALRHREEVGEARMYENYEALAKGLRVPAAV